MSLTRLPGFTLDTTSNATFANLTVTSNLASGNANLGNLATANFVSVISNITAGNANLGNATTSNYFIGNGSLLTGLPASYADSNVASYLPTFTGNLTAGNANLGNATGEVFQGEPDE